MPIYTSDELSNEEYHARPEISGSSLATIYNDCLAAWRFAEKTESKAMEFGTAAHAILLEPVLFENTFVREPAPDDYENVLITAKDMQAWLKERGIKGGSNKTKAELEQLIFSSMDGTGEALPIFWDSFLSEFKEARPHAKFLTGEDFDKIELMRATVFNDPEYAEALTGAMTEVSVINETHGVKARFDVITKGGEIWDYKSTASANPEDFGRQAHNLGYWLKMAFQHDIYKAEFGEAPKKVVLLAQSKKAPYIPQAYEITPEQLAIGREQYQCAFDAYKRARDSNVWPAYGGGVQQLHTPDWLARKYNF